jgi:hypothetical protein
MMNVTFELFIAVISHVYHISNAGKTLCNIMCFYVSKNHKYTNVKEEVCKVMTFRNPDVFLQFFLLLHIFVQVVQDKLVARKMLHVNRPWWARLWRTCLCLVVSVLDSCQLFGTFALDVRNTDTRCSKTCRSKCFDGCSKALHHKQGHHIAY